MNSRQISGKRRRNSMATAVYHGTKTYSTTRTEPVKGEVTENGQHIADVEGTQEVTTDHTVPHSVNYYVLTLSVESIVDGKRHVQHVFQGETLHPQMYGICTRNCHPAHALIEKATKWLSAGGLTDPTQSMAN
jgi:hypothetical protein